MSSRVGRFLVEQVVGPRLRLWLAEDSAKDLARRFGAEPRTAKAWKQGSMPDSGALAQMVAEWGVGFVEFLFAPVLDETDADLARRLERIEREIKGARRDHAAAVGEDTGAAGRPGGGWAGVDRAVADQARGPLARARQAVTGGAVSAVSRGAVSAVTCGAVSAVTRCALSAVLAWAAVAGDVDMARIRAPRSRPATPVRVVRDAA